MFLLTLKSSNRKTGPIPVSTSPKSTCPPSCPMRGGACYAQSGPLGIIWNQLDKGQRGVPWSDFLSAIRSLPSGQLWRHNQAGDLPGEGETVDPIALTQLVEAQRGKRGFTYTHKIPTGENGRAIRFANDNGFTVNLSADNPTEADSLADSGSGPVVCVLPLGAPMRSKTPAGRQIVVCPAQQREGVNCAQCQLCAKTDRKVIVGFIAHGTRAKSIV